MLKEWISNDYLKENKIKELRNKFNKASPFSHIVLKDFFDKKKLAQVLDSLIHQEFIEKNTDLFQFKQSQDISSINLNSLKDFYSFFSSREFCDYISRLTNTQVESIDMSGFFYQKTDYLLPHDDQLEGRKIAYVVNLSNKFKRKDGGRLQLFSVFNGKPKKIIKSYLPEFNKFILFKVSEISFHQVEEIMSNKERISLAGWFHGN